MERTATARGMSRHVDLSDSVMVEIRGDNRVGWLGLAAKQALDLRESGQHALLRPALDLRCGELQQGRQVLVACEAEPGAQRAFTHAAVDLGAQPGSWLYLPIGSQRPLTSRISTAENIGPKDMPRNPRGGLDGKDVPSGNRSAPLGPLVNSLRLDAKKAGHCCLAALESLNSSSDRLHGQSKARLYMFSKALLYWRCSYNARPSSYA